MNKRSIVLLTLLSMSLISLRAPGQAMDVPEPPKDKDDPKNAVIVPIKQSKVLPAPWPVKRVAVTAPEIADVQVLTPRQILLQGKAMGSTDLILWGEKEEVYKTRVEVVANIEQLMAQIKQHFPKETITLSQINSTVMVSGTVSTADQVAQLHKILDQTGLKYADLTRVAGVQQVMIQVRVAEVSRRAIRTLGFNALVNGNDFFGGITVGADNGGPINPISVGPVKGAAAVHGSPFVFTDNVGVSPAVTVFAGSPSADFQLFIQALAENQYLRILAEPNLVALSGEEAGFLVGGEFPIPVVQGNTTGGGTSISIEYKQFGVRLKFKPRVLGDNVIQLYVAPEVSELTDQGAVVLNGFRIPSLMTRRADTTLELKSGETFAMAGLISRNTTARSSRVPGAGDIPVLGALFRSVRYQQDETEFVVMVTATLVEPIAEGTRPPGPGILHSEPNDWELYGLGKIEGSTPVHLSPTDIQWLKKLGLDRLKGPGAWCTYDQQKAASRAEMAQPQKQQAATTQPAQVLLAAKQPARIPLAATAPAIHTK